MESVILLDISNLGYIAAASKNRLSAGSIDTTTPYGFIQIVRKVASNFKGKMVALHDGRSWRHAELAVYKDGREATQEQIDMRAAWKAAKPLVARLLTPLGIHQILAPNLEADDLAARFRTAYVKRGAMVTLVSSDKDWLQLIGENVQVFNTITDKLITAANFTEHTGLPHPRAIAERKALMGKVKEMPGVGGIGVKTAEALLTEFHSVEGFINVMGTDMEAYAKADRRARTLCDDPAKQDQFRQNMRLAWLDDPNLPKPENMKSVKGVFDKATFLDLASELAFFSIVRQADTWLEPFASKE